MSTAFLMANMTLIRLGCRADGWDERPCIYGLTWYRAHVLSFAQRAVEQADARVLRTTGRAQMAAASAAIQARLVRDAAASALRRVAPLARMNLARTMSWYTGTPGLGPGGRDDG